MSLPLKIGIGLATVGTVGGVGYSIFAYSQDKGTEISKLIEKEFQYKLLDTTAGQANPNKERWTAIWKEYKEKSQNVFKLNGWKSDGTSFDLTEALKEKCKELSTTKVSDSKDNTYQNVTKYCARGVTFEEQAKKDGLDILDTSGDGSKSIWDSRHTKKGEITSHLRNLKINTPNDGNAIKTGCNKAKENNKQIENYANVYESYKLICTKQGSDK